MNARIALDILNRMAALAPLSREEHARGLDAYHTLKRELEPKQNLVPAPLSAMPTVDA